MNEIEELERRLASAMERIANGLGSMGPAPAHDTSAISAELEDERLANAQLKERSRKLTEQLDTCLLYTSPSPRDLSTSRMPSSA